MLGQVDSLFKNRNSGKNAPESDFVVSEGSINVCDLFVRSGLASSKSEARRLIQQGGASVDGVRCTSTDEVYSKPAKRDYVLLKKGKKVFLKVKFI